MGGGRCRRGRGQRKITVDVIDGWTCFQQFALPFRHMNGVHALLPGHRGGRLSTSLKVWKLHWRDLAGQDVQCFFLLLMMLFRFALLFAQHRKSLETIQEDRL